MKRFLIPAVIVVDVEDNETMQQAENRAAALAMAGNEHSRRCNSGAYCMQDEKLPTKEVPINSEETEIPGTYLTDGGELRQEPFGGIQHPNGD